MIAKIRDGCDCRLAHSIADAREGGRSEKEEEEAGSGKREAGSGKREAGRGRGKEEGGIGKEARGAGSGSFDVREGANYGKERVGPSFDGISCQL